MRHIKLRDFESYYNLLVSSKAWDLFGHIETDLRDTGLGTIFKGDCTVQNPFVYFETDIQVTQEPVSGSIIENQ